MEGLLVKLGTLFLDLANDEVSIDLLVKSVEGIWSWR